MPDDLDHLNRLAPTVDPDRAQAAFRRRRRRSRSRRRGAMAAAAVAVLVAGTTVVVAAMDDDDDEAPVVAGPGGTDGPAIPHGPVTFEVLTVAPASDDLGTLRAATDEGGYVNLWKYANTSDPRPEVGFDQQVVVSITIPGDGCEPALTELERDGGVVTPVFVVREAACFSNLVARTYVVALDRAPLGAGFTLRLPAQELYGFGEQRLRVELGGGRVAVRP